MYSLLFLSLILNYGDVDVLGFMPKHQSIHVSSEKALADWDYKFDTLGDFVKAVNQGGFVKLDSGNVNHLFYVVFRYNEHLLIAVLPSDGGRFQRAKLTITNKDGSEKEFSNIKLISFIMTDVLGPITNNVSYQKLNVPLFGYSTPVVEGSTSSVIINFKGRIDPNTSGAFATTVPWGKIQ